MPWQRRPAAARSVRSSRSTWRIAPIIAILREALQYLTLQRVVAPGYTFLQDIIGRAITERQRTAHLLAQALTPEIKQQLEKLLQAGEGMYQISVHKHEPKDFS